MDISQRFYSNHQKECLPILFLLKQMDLLPELVNYIMWMYMDTFWNKFKTKIFWTRRQDFI